MADDGGGNHPLSDNVVVILIAMGSAAFVVSMYHIIAICLCHQRITNQNSQEQQPPQDVSQSLDHSTSSVAHLIPTHKYHKKKRVDMVSNDVDVGDESGTCAVCLGDFEEGEELKTMPECMHSFHVPCIDMWLDSHSSCPICRASAAPSPAVHHRDHDLNAHHHSIDMTPVAFLHSGLVRR